MGSWDQGGNRLLPDVVLSCSFSSSEGVTNGFLCCRRKYSSPATSMSHEGKMAECLGSCAVMENQHWDSFVFVEQQER